MIKNADTQPGILKCVFTGWNPLAFSGFGYVPGCVLLIVFTWKPKLGPYAIGERNPYGGYLEAWQVSPGFAFLAFGILFDITPTHARRRFVVRRNRESLGIFKKG
jgi:hypothetical protein